MKECFNCKRCFGDHNEICDLDESPLKSTLVGMPIIADKYRLDQRIGAGALGISYFGYDIEARRQVGVKIVLAEYVHADPECVPIFFEAVGLASVINHPNVARIFDYGESHAEYLYIVMEYLNGPSLKSILKEQGALALERAVNFTCAICNAVDAAHKLGQFHRDLKPANIVVVETVVPSSVPGSQGEVTESLKVLDFGLSRIKSPEMLNVLPPSRSQPSILGTPYYVSPEQAEREEIDERSEVYSIGIILYHMLTGEVPFKGHSYPSVLEQHISKQPRPPRELRPEIPESVDEVVLRAIEKDPDRRFQSVLALANLLRQALKQPASRRRMTGGTASRPAAPSTRSGQHRRLPSSRSEVKRDSGIQAVVSDLLAEIEPPPPRPTRRLKALRRTQTFERPPVSAPADSAPANNPPARPKEPESRPVPPPDAPKPSPKPLPSSPLPSSPLPNSSPPALSGSLPGSPQSSTRRKLPPPPPHEDKPEHYQKRPPLAAREEARPPSNGPQPATPKAPPPGLSPTGAPPTGSVCLIEPPGSSSGRSGGRLAGAKAESRPVALSPASIVYLFPDQFLPPKKLRQFKREMHSFFVVEREALAALLLVQAIFSLRRRGSLKLSPVSAIVPLLRRKLDLGEEEKFVLQLVNGAVKPLDVLERRVLDSLGKLNAAASLQAVYLGFVEAAEQSGRSIAAAELLNDTVADELVEYKLIERGQKPGNRPLDPGESDRSYRANDDEIERYFSQLDDIRQLITSVKEEPPITVGTQKVQLFDYLIEYYKELFLQNSQALISAGLKTNHEGHEGARS